MAKNRYIDTRFWHDTFVREKLNPLDRYLFLYFLTNDKTSICGVYELPISIMASETGIEVDMLKKMFKRLKGKVDYIDGWVYIKNFIRYQNNNSPKIVAGIKNELEKIPENIRKQIPYAYGIDTVSHSNYNNNSNSNSNTEHKNPNLSLEEEKEWIDVDFKSPLNKRHKHEQGMWVVMDKKAKKHFYHNKKFYKYTKI